jgi:hypothetical protein
LPVKGNLKIKGRFDSATLERCIKNIIAQQIDPGKDPDTELLNDGNERRCRVYVSQGRVLLVVDGDIADMLQICYRNE